MIDLNRLVKVGRFAKTHGVNGEINVDLTVDVDLDECRYFVVEMDGIPVPFFIDDYRYRNDNTVLVTLDGVMTDEKARSFFGRPVYVEPHHIDEEAASEIELYLGYMLVAEDGREIGRITAVDDSTANVLFEVGDILLPVAAVEVIDHDAVRHRLTVALPDGLLDLHNAPSDED